MPNPTSNTVVLAPRIRVDFVVIGSYSSGISPERIIKSILMLSNGRFDADVKLSEKNIKVERLPSEYRWKNKDVLVKKAQGSVFFRDLTFMDELKHIIGDSKGQEKLRKVREFLRGRMSTFKMFYGVTRIGVTFEIRAFSPVFEDVEQMMARHFDDKSMPPAIVVKGVPCLWFADHDQDSSQPSKDRLRSFFGTLGLIRNLDTSVNDADAKYCNVTIQFANYEECHKALEQLCSFSLRRAKENGGFEEVDYEVSWKDSDSVPQQEYDLAPASEDISEFKVLKHQMEVMQEQMKILEAKLKLKGGDI